MMKRPLRVAALACLCALAPLLPAQPYLPDVIAEDTTLTEPEYLVGETLVMPQATLAIPAGTVLRFASPLASLNVQGVILAEGEEGNPIVFTSAKFEESDPPRPGDWREVSINDASGASILRFCEFSYGGGQIPLANPVARVMLRIQAFPIVVEDCVFAHAFGSGAGYAGAAVQEFVRCKFLSNLYGGVSSLNPAQSRIRLVDCEVSGNYMALMGLWTSFDFPGTTFNNTFNSILLMSDRTIGAGERLVVQSPPPGTGLSGLVDGEIRVSQYGELEFAPFTWLSFSAGSRILVNGAFRTSAAGLATDDGAPVSLPFGVSPESAFSFFNSAPAFKLPMTLSDLGKAEVGEKDPSSGQPAQVIDPVASWRGIYFLRDSDDAQSMVQNLWIDHAEVGLYFDRASARVDACTITDSVLAGMRFGTAAHSEISRSAVVGSQRDGVVCESDAAPAISNTYVLASLRSGVVIRDTARPLLMENLIYQNRDGIEITGTAAPVLGNIDNLSTLDDGRNVIMDNVRYAVINDTRNRIMAQNNFWGASTLFAIDQLIYDDDENPMSGEVVFYPAIGQNPPPPTPATPTPTPTPQPFPVTPSPTPTPAVETVLAGEVNSDRALRGVVRVTGDVTVLGFATLSFEPGTIVRIEGVYAPLTGPENAIYIRARNGGRIHVAGRRDQPVVFTSAGDTHWGGLVVEGPELRPSIFKYAHVQRAFEGLRLHNTESVVEQCRFQYCQVGLAARRTAGTVHPLLRANIFMENELGVRTEGTAQPNMGTMDEPGGNVFYLNGMDLEVANTGGQVPARGNYWSEAGPNGEVVRLDAAEEVRDRRIAGDNSLTAVVITPLGALAGGGIGNSDAVWLGTVHLTTDMTKQTSADVEGYRIVENAVHVEVTSRLRILPGTVVRVQPRQNIVLLISGRLDALGTPARPIIFQSDGPDPLPTDWRGIRFIDGGDLSEPSVLRYCEVYDAYTGVTTIHRSPLLENLKIRNFADQGVLASSLGQYDRKATVLPAGVGNPFGIARPVLRDCDIRGGEYGLVCLDAAPVVTRSIITSSVISSIFVSGNNVPVLGNLEDADPTNDGGNVIGGSLRYDLENFSSSTIYAQNNFWGLVLDDKIVADRIFDSNERFYSGTVHFLPRYLAVPPYFIVLGDLDGDGQVGAADLAALSAAWRSVVGDAHYRPELDVDGDYQIDHKDLLFISSGLSGGLTEE